MKLGSKKAGKQGAYFTADKSHIEFVSTGCTLLNCVLGGGWVLGRVANVVGDKSTGKTLLAIEGSANFAHQYQDGHIRYVDSEAAFDLPYAESLGLPVDRIDFGDEEKPLDTVEDFFQDLERFAKKCGDDPGFYVLDSLDALSDEAEMSRAIDAGSYGGDKAKKMSQLFRREIRKLKKSRICLIIISQVRDKIGVMGFGEKHSRSGGKALDFYASQILSLTHMETLKRTVNGIKRPTGIHVLAKCKKNKIGLPFRECRFDIEFGYGVDDLVASFEWLQEVGRLGDLELTEAKVAKRIREIEKLEDGEYAAAKREVDQAVVKAWNEIETSFLPQRRKKIV